jgi:anthranilate synthase component 1
LSLGIVAHDFAASFENLPPARSDPLGFPDLLFWLAESIILFEDGAPPRAICARFDNGSASGDLPQDDALAKRVAELVTQCKAAPNLEPIACAPARPDHSEADISGQDYEDLVRVMKAHIRAGDVYQIVPSRTFHAPCRSPLRAFRNLSSAEPWSYQFYVAGPEHRIFGASPEFAVRAARQPAGIRIESNPIAGTRPRGGSADEDDRLELELRTDIKEIAEHVMLVDLARNDVARISTPGTRHVAQLMKVTRHARVMHLESIVEGQLREGLDAFHALIACLNVGTLTGAPKIRAMQVLREAEPAKRGPYGGAIGWINGQGDCDSAVVIRTAVIRDEIAYVRAGAGVVSDSDPEAERRETEHKSAAVLSAIAGTRE